MTHDRNDKEDKQVGDDELVMQQHVVLRWL
jgi:hypothetical protein